MSCNIICSEKEILNPLNCECENPEKDEKILKIKSIINECENRINILKQMKNETKNKLKTSKSKKDLKNIKIIEEQLKDLSDLYKEAKKKCRMQNQNIINIVIDTKKEKETEVKKEPEIKPFEDVKLIEPDFNFNFEIKETPKLYENEYEKIFDELKEKHKEIKKEKMLTEVEIEKLKSEENLIRYKHRKNIKDENYLKKIY